ncbi:MAG: DUF3048 domain-containing protein [Anaerovoracaceae bacterium]|jgi:hypothetical protein
MHAKSSPKKWKVPLIILIAALAATGVAAWWWYTHREQPAPVPAAPEINPLTGQVVKKGSLPSRPVIVSTDNDNSSARPQSGWSKADIIYEVPIEGGGSRYEPIYYGSMPRQAGPTRSARPYIVDIAREYRAIFVHNGWSPQAKKYLKTGVVDNYAAQEHDAGFYRTTDRTIPHNQYTNVRTDWKLFRKEGYDKKQEVRTFSWLGEDEEAAGKSAKTVFVNYADSIDNTFTYDAASGLYRRAVNGEPSRDLDNGRSITCANVLVQKVSSHLIDSTSQRLRIDMTEGGKAWLFTQGRVVKGTWSRSGLDEKTVFADSEGKELCMTPGKTSIELIDDTVDFSWK